MDGQEERCLLRNGDAAGGKGIRHRRLVSLRAELLSRCTAKSTIVSVPVSRLPELVYQTKKDLADHGIMSTILGHVGDGMSRAHGDGPRYNC